MEVRERAGTDGIEVWLRQGTMGIDCDVVFKDETTDKLDVDSFSMRGAQREMTGWLLSTDFKALGRWEMTDDNGRECVRRFLPVKRPAHDDLSGR